MDEFRDAIRSASAGDHQTLEDFMTAHVTHDDDLPLSLVCWAINVMCVITRGNLPAIVADFGRGQLGNDAYQRIVESWENHFSGSPAPQEVVVP